MKSSGSLSLGHGLQYIDSYSNIFDGIGRHIPEGMALVVLKAG